MPPANVAQPEVAEVRDHVVGEDSAQVSKRTWPVGPAAAIECPALRGGQEKLVDRRGNPELLEGRREASVAARAGRVTTATPGSVVAVRVAVGLQS